MCGTDAITRSMAETLYVGMMTDTGNFAFSFLTPELFRAVAVLLEKGISIPDIHNSVYNAYTEGRARLFGYAINRKMEVIQDGTVAYMSLMENESCRFQFQQGDSRGIRQLRPHDQKGQNVGHVPGAPQVHPRLAAFAGRCRRQPLRPEIFRRRRSQERRRAASRSFRCRRPSTTMSVGEGVAARDTWADAMDDFRLKVFITAARTLSFTRTTEQLYISAARRQQTRRRVGIPL